MKLEEVIGAAPLFNAQTVKNIDAKAVQGNPELGFVYMTRAAQGIVATAMEMLSLDEPDGMELEEEEGAGIALPPNEESKILVFCGKGNNGGDGYLAATMLVQAGFTVEVFGLQDPDTLTGEAAMAFAEFAEMGLPVRMPESVHDLQELPWDADLIIDALIGTGLRGPLKGLYLDVCKWINEQGVPVMSVDCPSGYNEINYSPGTGCVQADITVMMGFPRYAAFFAQSYPYFGEARVCELEYPEEILVEYLPQHFIMMPQDSGYLLPIKDEFGTKRQQGVVTMVAGSRQMPGAAFLATGAALRSGAGYVQMVCTQEQLPIYATKLSEPVFHCVPATQEGSFAFESFHQILQLCQKSDAVCLGPGLSTNAHTAGLVRELVANYEGLVVLDGDGLNAFVGHTSLLGAGKASLVLTPHQGEWERLFGAFPAEPHEQLNRVKTVADQLSCTIIFKGPPSIMASPSHNPFVFFAPNAGLGKAGSGDVLSGIITSFMAQGMPPVLAAYLGMQAHAQAAEFAESYLTQFSMLPGDLSAMLPEVFRQWLEE
jgi:ADP-dependent NAD(P)H-hydrate dehydratase / NAD(P)H-hydrate epimerase